MAAPTLPVWDSNGTNITATTAGHQSDGYGTNEIPTSGELNYFMRQCYLCLAYIITTRILEGDYQFTDNVDIDGDLDVGGNTSIGGALTIATTLDVVGDATFDTDISHTFYKQIDTGFEPSLFTNMTWQRATNGLIETVGAGAFLFVGSILPLRVGDRIQEARVLLPLADNPTTVALKVSTFLGGVDTAFSFTVTAGSEDSTAVARNVGGIVVGAGERYWWEISGTAAAAFSTSIARLQLGYDHP